MADDKDKPTPVHDHYRADLNHYWGRLMWYRDELWRVTTPVWAVYGAFIASCIGFVWSKEKGQVTAPVALMLIVVIVSFSWVIQRVYWTYAHRIYTAINELNKEVQNREQRIYDAFMEKMWTADYGRFRVYPELNVLFSIVGVAMMFACIFTIAASVGFDFRFSTEPLSGGKEGISISLILYWVVLICALLVGIFEWVLLKNEKRCVVCDGVKVKANQECRTDGSVKS